MNRDHSGVPIVTWIFGTLFILSTFVSTLGGFALHPHSTERAFFAGLIVGSLVMGATSVLAVALKRKAQR